MTQNRKIPLYRRPGGAGTERGVVVAFALVDEEDWHRFSRFRWRLTNGYAMTTSSRRNPIGPLLGRSYFLHRLILGLELADPRVADHINRDRLDNRRANLRIVTRTENNQNRNARRDGRSQHRGVVWHKPSGSWHARFTVNGKTHSGGYFRDEDAAATAAAELRARYAV